MTPARVDRAFAALVRKLHAAELQHLRQVVADQQAKIEEQAAQIQELERACSWADGRADMFQDLANELQAAQRAAQVGLTLDGRAGVLQ